eukprot:m.192807 g.192807  ORF g.192807 m.192807 type:complete len:740 (-) comp16969_c0_seq5:123-2342(-)
MENHMDWELAASLQELEPRVGEQDGLDGIQIGHQALLTISCGKKDHSQRRHICLVIDASVSMTEPLQGHDAVGPIIYNCSVLDLVLHAAKLAVKTLNDNDVISVIRFSNVASVIVPPTRINTADPGMIEDIIQRIMTIRTTHGTHLWGGVQAGLNCLRTYQETADEVQEYGRLYNVCMAITDGEPNRAPATGWRGIQDRYQNAYGFSDYTLNTLGFGYSLDSKLLMHLARDGNGVYANIPDCKLLGTVFTNMLAQAKVTTHKRLRLSSLSTTNGGWFKGVVGNYKTREYYRDGDPLGWLGVELGTLAAGQERHFVINMTKPLSQLNADPEGRVGLVLDSTACCTSDIEAVDVNVDIGALNEFQLVARLRCEAGMELMQLHHTLEDGIKAVQLARLKRKQAPGQEHGLIEALERLSASSSQAVDQLSAFVSARQLLQACEGMHLADEYAVPPSGFQALYADLKHQVKMALSSANFERWGHSYLLALAMAYQQHFTLNSKDPGVQGLSGSVFDRISFDLSAEYEAGGVPEPTGQDESIRSPRCWSDEAKPLAIGLQLGNKQGGCYSSDSRVSLADGTTKACVDVRPGDVLLGGGVVAKVAKFLIQDGQTRFCQLGDGLWITPYHPVWLKEEGGWVFPCHVVKPVMLQRKSMCSFVLEAGSGHHVAVVGGVKTITLGHNIVDDVVLKHDFFGSDKIRARLEELDEAGDGSGVVTFEPSCMVANSKGKIVDVDTSKAVSISAH